MVDFHRECPRIIRPNKYETQTHDTFNWWWRLFAMMEKDFAIPQFQRMEVIERIFPQHMLAKIISIVTMKEEQTPEGYRLERSASTIETEKRQSFLPSKTVLLSSDLSCDDEIIEDQELKESFSIQSDDVLVEKYSGGFEVFTDKYKPIPDKYCHNISKSEGQRREVGSRNPYTRFFKSNPERVAIWRDLPPLTLEEMNLNQKAEAITEAIAIDFINWIKKIGGESQTALDVPQVVKMFEIGFNTHAATSLVSKVKEMPAVTKAIADVRMLPKKAVRAKLYQKIREDVRAFKKPKKLMAFGTTLPSEMRYMPPKQNLAAKWLHTKTDERLENMSAVWEGITNLRSTTGFCKWLMEHPDIPRPKYLEQLGMIRPSFFKRLQLSLETQDSVIALPQSGI